MLKPITVVAGGLLAVTAPAVAQTIPLSNYTFARSPLREAIWAILP